MHVMLFDCAALAIGLYASYISRMPANYQFNYGRGRFEVLSGYVNAVLLVLVGALIVLESFERILDPQEISTSSLLVVSIGGFLVNVVGLIFFHEEHHHAHGGSCSHSHSHDHKSCGKPHDCNSISPEVQGNSCSIYDDHDHHHHDEHNHAGQHNCAHHEHDHAHQHNHAHQDHSHHEHDCAHHEHDHTQHHDHSHHGDHHDHAHRCDLHAHESLLPNSVIGMQSDVVEPPKKQHLHIDHNMEGIFLHVLADTLGSVGVVISTLLIKYKGWLVADPACSIFISVLIISSVIPLLRNSAEILLQRVPRAHEKDLKEAVNNIMKIRGVCGIQNLHVWSFTNTDVVGTVHLHVSAEADKASTKAQVSHIIGDARVKDLTLQMECIKS